MPRATSSHVGAPSARTWPNGVRLVSEDPVADLQIAVLEATWAQGVDPEPEELRALLSRPDATLRRSAARLVGLDPEAFPDLGLALPDVDPLAARLAQGSRQALRSGEAPRGFHFPGTAECLP
jgi:hypothetical protein